MDFSFFLNIFFIHMVRTRFGGLSYFDSLLLILNAITEVIFKYFQEQILKMDSKGVLLTCSKKKLDRKWLVQCILKFSNFVLFLAKNGKN